MGSPQQQQLQQQQTEGQLYYNMYTVKITIKKKSVVLIKGNAQKHKKKKKIVSQVVA